MRIRLAFNIENAKHEKALKILLSKHPHDKTDFISDCIIEYEKDIRGIVKQAVQDVLEGGVISTQKQEEQKEFKRVDSLCQIPKEYIDLDW